MTYCFRCGRRLKNVAVTVPASGSHPAGALGLTCARKAGLLPEPKTQLFTALRRSRKTAVSRQEALL